MICFLFEEGENVIGVQLGNGWYHQTKRVDEGKFIFGFPKLRYELTMLQENGEEIFLESDPETLWKPGEVTENNLFWWGDAGSQAGAGGLVQGRCRFIGVETGAACSCTGGGAHGADVSGDRVLRSMEPVLLEKER